ncbi:MAG: CarD family transcriptional regulator [Actinomycetota bacterium]|nr:CarD family transcriptional regulator [Actinomycetota bacterium]
MFEVGDKVVYPHHGAGIVERIEERDIDGECKTFFVLSLYNGDLKVTVSQECTEEIGLRPVIGKSEIESVFDVLNQKQSQMPTNWNHRYKKNREKITSGDIYQVAEVVRNLSLREREKGLSTGEKRMLGQARKILLSELIYVMNITDEEASKMLDGIFTA